MSVKVAVKTLPVSQNIEQFSLKCREEIGFVLIRYAIGVKISRHPIRGKTKTNFDSLAQVFPRFSSATCIHLMQNQIDCKAGTTAKGQNLLANISTSRASLLQGQYLIQEK